MPGLLLPRSVAEERDQINAERRAQVFRGYAEQWTKELQRVDPYLEVVRASDTPTDPDLKPGGWYLLKRIPGSVDELIELPHPPGPWIYPWLMQRDMWNSRIYRDKKAAKEKYRQAQNRAKAREREQRRDEMALALRAAERLRGDSGMTKRTDNKGKPTEHSVGKEKAKHH